MYAGMMQFPTVGRVVPTHTIVRDPEFWTGVAFKSAAGALALTAMLWGATHAQRRLTGRGRRSSQRASAPLTEGDLWWIGGWSFLVLAVFIGFVDFGMRRQPAAGVRPVGVPSLVF